ncbi:MAG: 3-oxoacyl-[acyl-carrier protein] reductase [Clostridiales bacterium]|jgi:NAD(P)-dependent dehydrogenase (short-subunit alcohol dehydrogenase family)|nr:3-oxoacyl-[acyl-carrier protein] reductase [Clostridiales bacterium]
MENTEKKGRLSGKVAIVTGAGTKRGIGRATAFTFAKEGAKVVVQDINLQGAENVAAEIRSLGCDAIALGGNVAVHADMEAMAKTTVEKFKCIDILAHIAGITQSISTLDMASEDWERIISVNLTGTFNAVKAVLPFMVEQRYGRIVAVSSVSAKRGGGIFGGSHYSAAKAGVLGFIKNVAREVARYGVYANAVAPGLIDTDITGGMMTDERREELKKDIPLGRLGTPQDVANAILFLASDESSYVTGEVMDVNGGSHID